MKKLLSTLIVMTVIVTAVCAAPFGLEWGMTFDEFKELGIEYKVVDQDNDFYEIALIGQPPKAVKSIPCYNLGFYGDEGLYTVLGYSHIEEPNTKGTNTKNTYNQYKAMISRKYGEPDTEFDFLDYGSIWDEPDDFMYALKKQEYHLGALWNEIDDGSTVYILTMASSIYSSTVYLGYYGPNNATVEALMEAEAQAVEDDAL